MTWLGARLFKHTVVAATIFGSTVLAPFLLLLRKQCGETCIGGALVLLTAGSAALLGAAACRGLDRGSMSTCKWRLVVASVWVFNPVPLAAIGLALRCYEMAWWSAMPLAVVLALLSGRTRLTNSDPDWVQEGCPLSPALLVHWLFSRVIFVGMPMLLVSLQVDLCLPYSWMFPQSAMVGLLVCGGCVLISLKFCVMCHCLASQRLAQALVLVLLLASDWISSLHLMDLVTDDAKDSMLLYLLLAAGVVQLKSSLSRLSLRSRWARAWRARRARQMGSELASSMTVESSDSDNEQGHSSLPESFHEALVALLGFNVRQEPSSRQFLCGVRLAVPQNQPPDIPAPTPAPQVAPAPAAPPGGTPASGPTGNPPAASPQSTGTEPPPPVLLPLEISSEHEKCVVCMEEFQPGDRVRPLPKCAHVFHASCLEQWIMTGNSREATKCPMCRRPALARKQEKGSTKLSELHVEPTVPSGRNSREGRRSQRSDQPGEPRAPRTRRPPRRPNRSQQLAVLSSSLGVSELMAQVALDISGSGPGTAANLLLEHRSVLESDYTRGRGRGPFPLEDAVPHVVAASPSLVGAEVFLARQLRQIAAQHAHLAMPWMRLSAQAQEEVFRELLLDVQRRVEARAERIQTAGAPYSSVRQPERG
ncbi:unnamed protein product [Durusdinium trenchii]|uniref:RING-type domain-containing protein n=2 Tax=Durusdinium trenchii TaxID=1381693 RepID=A0ABP0QHQ6_9DINO